MFHFFAHNENVQVIAETLRHITKPVFGQFFFIYLLFYTYSVIGMLLFGGDLSKAAFEETSAPNYYYLMNFNDFGCAMVTLFHQMIINNWFITVDMYVAIKGGQNWYRLYFVSFWIITVLIMFNTFIAIILEIHSSVSSVVR